MVRLDGRSCVANTMLLLVFGCGEAGIDSGSGSRGGSGDGGAGVVGQYGEAATQDPIAGIGGVDEECHWDGSCNEGLVCLGTCQYASEFPGAVGGPCFEDGTCHGALECRDGTCADVDALEDYFNQLTLEDPGELFGDDALLSTSQGLEVAPDLDLSTVGQLPGRVTLNQYIPPVGNQGRQGSCVSWAMGYGLASYMIGVRNQNPPNRNDELMSPAYLHNQTMNYRDCHSGPPGFDRAREIMHGQGIAPLSVMAYSTDRQGCTQQVTQQMRSAASQNKLREVYHLNKMNTLVRSPSPPTSDVLTDGDLNQIKTLLSRGYPVAIAIRTYAEFMRMGRNAVQSTMTPRQDTNLGHNYHAILAIGYDDARQTILVMNSWGSAWGNRGTAEISYNVFKKITGIAYAGIARDMPAQSAPEPSPQLPTTPAPAPTSFTCDSVTLGRAVPQNTCIQIDSARACRWFRCTAPNDYTEMSPSNLSGCAQQFAHQSCSGSSMPDPMPEPMPEPSTSTRRGQFVATLYWNARVDLDINAVEPSGTTISHSHSTNSPNDGYRTECNPISRGCQPNGDGLYSEKIVWGERQGSVANGVYNIYVRNYTSGTSANYTMRVEYFNSRGERSFERTYQGSTSSSSPIHVAALQMGQ